MVANAISVPRNISRPKVKSVFKPDGCYNDVDEDHFLFPDLGKTVFRSSPWNPGLRDDVLKFDESSNGKLFRSARIHADVPSDV